MQTIGFDAIASQWGLFAALFVALLVYVIKENKAREKDYQLVISKLADDIKTTTCDSNKIVKSIDSDVDLLHDKITGIAQDVDHVKLSVSEIKTSVDHIQNTMALRKQTDAND